MAALTGTPVFCELKKFGSFEEKVRYLLTLDREEILKDNLCSERWKTMLNSLRFWSKKFKSLMTDTMIFVTLFDEAGDSYLNVDKVLDEVEKITSLGNLELVFRPENNRYLGLDFKTSAVKDLVQNSLKFVGKANVVNVAWGFQSGEQSTVFRLHWTTKNMNEEIIKKALNLYMDIEEIMREKMKRENNIFVPTSVLIIKGKVKPLITMKSIPHLIFVGKNECLLTIKDRAPLCLNCRREGHVKKDCRYFYCKICKNNVSKDHDCDEMVEINSYAAVTKRELMANRDRDIVDDDSIGDNGVLENDILKLQDSSSLTRKVIEKLQSTGCNAEIVRVEDKDKLTDLVSLKCQVTASESDANEDMCGSITASSRIDNKWKSHLTNVVSKPIESWGDQEAEVIPMEFVEASIKRTRDCGSSEENGDTPVSVSKKVIVETSVTPLSNKFSVLADYEDTSND